MIFKKISLILTALFLFTACQDFVEEPIKGQQTLDNYFYNKEEARTALMGAYASLSPQDWWEMDFFWLVGDICSDNAFKGNSIEGDQRDFGRLARFNIKPNNEWLEIKYRYTYKTIYRANLIIHNVPDAPIDQETIRQYVAEARFLRAYGYFELIKNFGGVPLVTNPISPEEANKARASEAEVWAQIEQDLKDAAEALPYKSEYASDQLGRATKGAANSYLAKAYLWQEKYGQAQTTAEKVITSSEYNLNDPFSQVWSVDNPNGNGSIFEIQHKYDAIYDAGNALPTLTRSRADGGWGFATPSSHLEQAMQGDPRLEWTIINQGDSVDAEHPSYDTKPSENMSGRINRKYYLKMANRPDKSAHTRGPLNQILLRYADLLLSHAEAAYHNDDESSALTSLNKVRDRVGLDDRSSSGSQLLEDIYHERRMELAMEGHRYYFLKRTDQLEQAITEFVDYNLNESTDPYDSGNPEGQLFQPGVHDLFPIPQQEIDLSEGKIDQNPGY